MLNDNRDYFYLNSADRIADTTRSQINRFMLLPMLPGVALLDLAYYLHSKRLSGPFDKNWVMGLNVAGFVILLCCGMSLIITALVKAVRRYAPARRHKLLDIIAGVGGFVAATVLAAVVAEQVWQQYDRLEQAALAKHGVTLVVPVAGRSFQGGAFPEFRLFFHLPDRRGGRFSVVYPHDASVDTVTQLTIRYLPANPEIYRGRNPWN